MHWTYTDWLFDLIYKYINIFWTKIRLIIIINYNYSKVNII